MVHYAPEAPHPTGLGDALQTRLVSNPWGFTPRKELFWGIGADRAHVPAGFPDLVLEAEAARRRQDLENFGSSWQWPRRPSTPENRQICEMMMEELTHLPSGLVHRQKLIGHRRYDYDYTPRRSYYLLELPKFSGKLEDYPLFRLRQNLNICLERERFRDEKDRSKIWSHTL
jgi:hypothetical protein